MSAPADRFETTARVFAGYQRTVASRLRYRLAQINLRSCHNLDRRLGVLDAGGGNGLNSEFLLALGHDVVVYDMDREMLTQAAARIEPRELPGRCRFVQGALEEITGVLRDERYDLILCHHVLEYLDDGLKLLGRLIELAAPGGELSLITLNPVSEVVRAMVFGRDPAKAAVKLDDLGYDAKWFGQARLYPLDDILARADSAGWRLKEFRGIRVLADYMPEPDAELREEELVRLEEALGSRDPYRRIGRYLQFSFAKPAAVRR